MPSYQEIEKVNVHTKANFEYAGLRVMLSHRYEGGESWNSVLVPFVEIYWEEVLLASGNSLPDVIVSAFNAVRVCRLGLAEKVGESRTAILVALSSLSYFMNVGLGVLADTPEMETRLHPNSERVREAIPNWDDIPQVVVHAGMSSINRSNFEDEAVKYRIVISTSTTTFTHRVNGPVWDLPDIYTLVDDLVIKHFA